MKKILYARGKRLLAMVLTLALLLTFMPNVALKANAAIETKDIVANSKKVDPYTIHNWKQYFDIMSTEYVGGVWSDKSVFQSFADYLTAENIRDFVGPNGSVVSDDVMEMLATDPANFLVTMSAITANKSISGSASTPMDNMLVLDVSGSMQGNNAEAVVEATNRAIKTLLDQNANNRIGVVLYSGNHQQGSSRTSTASVLLPLGRYTTTDTMSVGNNSRIPAYLTISGSGNSQTVRVADSVNNGNAADSKTVRGGTYIQNGLYQAWQQFEAVTDVKIPAGQPQAGTQRTPVIVLMSDGAPTTGTTSYNNVGTSNLGDGMDTTDRIGFMTQLTAAWVRGKVQEKYGTAPKFYSLGVGTGNDSIATSVVNPAGSNTTLTGYWNTFMRGTNGQNVEIVADGWFTDGWSVYKDAAVAGKNYVDRYWLTSDSAGLINAFTEIVNTIVLESENYSTLVDMTQGADMSGYVTFEDELGQLMEVKSVKGMVMGNVVFTGAELAKGMSSGVLGTVDGPTAAGDELVRTVKERMGITEASVAQTLIDNAYNAGQLSYTDATHYSNYIGWYADENGKYVGFWQESDGYTADNAPKDAKYINKSYGYLGEPLTEDGAGSDMMHIVVMVHTEIATGHQSVVYKIPASLLPSVTYHVELNGENIEDPESMTRDGADPIRLLFEVGLRSDINTVNLEEKIAEHKKNGGHIHKNNDGTYSFYTNSWGSGDGDHDVDYDEPLTHLVTESHFNPSLENERYYHVEDDLVYSDQNGTIYNGAARPTAGYFARPYYEVVGGAAKYTVKYAPINADVLKNFAEQTENASTWYIPEGTAHSLSRFALNKRPNETDTLNYSWNPVILHDNAGYHSYTFLGNNGTFKLAPAQGISITKTVTEKVPGASEAFGFIITLNQAAPNLKVTDADGNNLGARVTGNEIHVILADGETVVLSGIPTGTTYTVEEVANSFYTPTIQGATGTVAAGTITKVTATNTPKVYNDLIVSKDVTHPFVNVPDALKAQQFTIVVDLDGEGVANTDFAITGLTGVTSVHTDGDGKFSVQLRDDESFTVKNLPAGTTYTVTETNLPAGYALVTDAKALTGTIREGNPAQAHLVNNYHPYQSNTTLTITGTKTVDDSYGVPYDWTNKSFQFKLESYDPTTETYTQVGQLQTVTQNGGRYSFGPLSFDTLGTYYYKVSEVIPTGSDRDEHMSYDATAGRVVVHVTDNDVDGKMEITVQNAVTGETVAASTDAISVGKHFVNVYKEDFRPGYLEIPVKKEIADTHNTGVTAAGFLFGMYKVDKDSGVTATTPTYTVRTTGADGVAKFHVPYAGPLDETYVIKEIIPADEDKIPGMIYDTTEYTVEISVDYDANGVTTRYTIYENGQPVNGDTVEFTNTMDLTPATKQFTVKKNVEGNPPAEDYTFTLTETDGSFVAAKQGGITDTVKINGNGSKVFDEITYNAVGTHYYVVKETKGDNPGITYDASEYHITVNVTANGKTLVANTTITKLGTGTVQNVEFTNTYKITGTAAVNIHGLKKLDGRDLLAGEFEFGLYENGALVGVPVKNATNGKFTFPTITYTQPGNHTYTVKEIVPTEKLGGVTYSPEEYTVVVEVTDNGAGGLNVSEKITKGTAVVEKYDDLIITNTYTAARAEKDITATKTWQNTDTGANKTVPAGKFSFTLYNSDATYTTEEDGVTVENDAQGKVTFTKTYTAIGTHHYILREVIGDETTVGYDAGRYLIQDVVTDDGKGQLHVIRTVVRDGVGQVNTIDFNNLYTPASSEPFAISGMKTLTGRKLEDGEFSFGLYQDGELLQEAKNDGNTFAFDAIVYDKSGTYTYTVKEQAPVKKGESYKGVTYDYTEYQVTVTVTDDNGKLKVASSHTPAQLTFKNAYEIAETPKTGDTANLPLYASMMALSALGFVAMLVLRKKEEHAN